MKYSVLLIISFFYVNVALGQSYFERVSDAEAQRNVRTERSIVPNQYQVSKINIDLLKKYLTENVSRSDEGVMLHLIDPEGEEVGFKVFETKMMQEGLAAKYPEIKTYKGYNPKRKFEKVYFGISNTGFYASVNKPGESYSIDRYADKQDQYYISYYLKDYEDEAAQSYTCGTEGKEMKTQEPRASTRSSGALLPLREYRFALACTGEFGAFYGPEISDVLGEMMKSVNRMNLILENDFAIRLVLVNDNDLLINFDAQNDPYSDGNTGGTLLTQNTAVVTNKIGFANFDIGHVYTRGCDDTGGIAFIESACAGNKGGGVTCHYSNDITAMAVRVAAHEVGHQLGSNHTFNNCNGNENTGTAYEPGSGTTIMSYAGLCGSELNVINTANDYFHISSIIEITSYTRDFFGDNCPTKITTNNHIPDINLSLTSGFSIPISTPFELDGEATDEDGDSLTYTWEQYNLGMMAIPGAPVGNSPLFVSAYPSADSKRIFPKISSIVNNVSDKTEVLPTYERDLNFQFVVRDNNIESGGVAWEEIEFYASESAGPFLVEFPSSADTFEVGQEIEVLWDVANTDNDIIKCKTVDILLSTDGGFTYDKVLVTGTLNDGVERISIPNSIGSNLRIKIKAADNIFFDISNDNFVVQEAAEPGFLVNYDSRYIQNCVPDLVEINITSEGFSGFSEEINFEVSSSLPEGMMVEFSSPSVPAGGNTRAVVSFGDASLTGTVAFDIIAYSGEDTLTREIILDLVSVDFSDVLVVSPQVGSSGNKVSPVFTWTGDPDAEEYEIRISDNPSFLEELSEELYIVTVQDTFFNLSDILQKNTVYYWQLVAKNNCGQSLDSEIYAFATEAVSCNSYTYNDLPVGISQSGVIEVLMPIDIVGAGEVRDVNIQRIRGTHTWVSELRGELTSPSGTNVLLFRNKCGNQSNFNAGFDDDALGEVTCPFSQGTFYQPDEKLDTFIGEPIDGEWIFKLTDTKVGNGGTVQEYILEICSNAVLDGPELVKNEPMALPSGVGRRISSDFLLTEDVNNGEDELIYTLVRLPLHGILRNEDSVLVVGSQFTQMEVSAMNIRYQHDGMSDDDRFFFTVEDGEGGWISTTAFEIVIDNDITISTDDLVIPSFRLYPNPASSVVSLVFSDYQGLATIEMFDVMGRKVVIEPKRRAGQYQVSVAGLSDGIYFMSIRGEGFNAVRKIQIVKN